jgi:hypothetical protein
MKKLKLPWIEKGNPTTVAVYKKSKRGKSCYMIITNIHVDVLNNGRATKPIIDHKYEIVELGVGFNFIERWSSKYGIKNPQIITK